MRGVDNSSHDICVDFQAETCGLDETRTSFNFVLQLRSTPKIDYDTAFVVVPVLAHIKTVVQRSTKVSGHRFEDDREISGGNAILQFDANGKLGWSMSA